MTETTRTAGGIRQATGSSPTPCPDAEAGGQPARYRLGLLLVTGSAVAWSLAGLFTRLIHLDTGTLLAWRGLFGGRDRGRRCRAARPPGVEPAPPRLAGVGLRGRGRRRDDGLHRGAPQHDSRPRGRDLGHGAVLRGRRGWIALREVPTRSAAVASLAALGGVVLTVGLDARGGLHGDALAVGMTAMMAAMMVIARRYCTIPAMTAAALSVLLSGLACLPFAHLAALSTADLGLLALFGLVNSAAGLALFTLGARLLPTMETALIGALDASLAPLWVWLAFAEKPSHSTMVGGLVVFVAVATYIWLAASRLPA